MKNRKKQKRMFLGCLSQAEPDLSDKNDKNKKACLWAQIMRLLLLLLRVGLLSLYEL